MKSASRLLLFALAALAVTLAACTPNPVLPDDTEPASPTANIVLPIEETTSLPDGSTETPQVPEETTISGDFAARLTYTEGDRIELNTDATSPDGVPVALEFSRPFDADGTWQTAVGDAGDYPVTVTARDSRGLETSQRILVTIMHANRAPVIVGPESIAVDEGDTITLRYSAEDPDEGDSVVLSFSGWMKSDSYTTDYDDAGRHIVTVTASDGELTTRKEVPVIVSDVNRAPELYVDQERINGIELVRIRIDATARDPDGDDVTISYGKPFDDSGRWTPQYDDEGEYTVSVTAADSEGATTVQDVLVRVVRANRPAKVSIPGGADELRYQETDFIDLTDALSIEDEEEGELVVRYSGWMTSATKQTGYDDAGEHTVTVTVTDSEGLITTTDVSIVVEDVNRPPVFTRIA